MIRKAQAALLQHRDEVHYPLSSNGCGKARVNGKMQTWKTRPDDFRVPLKVGFRGFAELSHANANEFYLPADCPVCKEDK